MTITKVLNEMQSTPSLKKKQRNIILFYNHKNEKYGFVQKQHKYNWIVK